MSKNADRPADMADVRLRCTAANHMWPGGVLRNLEMTRVLKTTPVRMISDSSSGAIAHWRHDPLHDVVEPMTDSRRHDFPGRIAARFERRTG